MCGAGDAVKIVTFVLNCQLFKTKVQLLFKIHFLVRTHQTTTTKTTGHGIAHFGPTQQPTNNLAALVELVR
jgi:hypothetical protein